MKAKMTFIAPILAFNTIPLTKHSSLLTSRHPMAGVCPPWMVACQRFGRWLLAAGVAAIPQFTSAQTPAVTGSPNQASAAYFQILQQSRSVVGGHSVTYNLVVPPVRPNPTAAPQPSPTPAAENSAEAAKDFRFIFFSATVYDRKFTVLRWFSETSPETFTAVSNVDFNLFTSIPEFETQDTVYDFFMALDNETVANADPVTARELAQAGAVLPTDRSAYIVVSGSAGSDALSAFDDFHSYFDANKAWLVRSYWQKQQQMAQQELWLRLHPPVIPNPVINFWPIKSAVFRPGQ
jgi:hypothetical protein